MSGLKETVKGAWDGVLSPLFEEFSADVKIECLDPSTPEVDPVYGEPVAEKQYLPPVIMKARIKMANERLVKPGGEEVEADGRITLRTENLEASGATLDFSTRITAQGRRYAVAHIETAAQVGEEFLLTRVWLKEV